MADGLREAAELVLFKVQNVQRGELADGLREAADLVDCKEQSGTDRTLQRTHPMLVPVLNPLWLQVFLDCVDLLER